MSRRQSGVGGGFWTGFFYVPVCLRLKMRRGYRVAYLKGNATDPAIFQIDGAVEPNQAFTIRLGFGHAFERQ